MSGMRRGLVHTTAWLLATGAAVAMSWYGVRTVLTRTAYDPPRAFPLAGTERPGAETRSSSTHRPRPSPTPSPSHPAATGTPTEPDRGTREPTTKPPPTTPRAPDPDGGVRGYRVEGGRVVFDIGAESAKLVSATPASGWQMQTWRQDTWIRVDFVSGAATTSVFCTWHDGPPRVTVD